MRKWTLIFTVMFCGMFININAQDKKGTLDGSGSEPQITFEKLEYDFGTVKKGAEMKYDFKFKNTGKAPLILNNVKAACGCTTPTWPKEPVAPDKENSIKVAYDSKRVGSFSKSITITSNAKTPTIELIIKGTVTDELTK